MPSHLRLVRVVALLLLALLLAPLAAPATAAPATAGSRFFAQTGQSVQGEFLTFFDRNGGVAIFGYPITGEVLENGITVQYFQRARMEWHPGNAAAYRVQLGLLGEQIHGQADPRVQPVAATGSRTARYFPETGHNVTNAFLTFWSRNGGLATFGYPLGEAFIKEGVTFQWFQRARFEYRNGRMELGLLGSEWTSGRPNLPAAPLPADTLRRRAFPQTGQTVQGAFLDFWEQRGGQARFGLPLSGEFTEGGRTVQYFEYARFEKSGAQVQLGLLGTELHGPAEPPMAAFAPPWDSNHQYFAQTGHTVSNAFLRQLTGNGGVDIYGYPITEAYQEGGEIIQWFQRRKLTFGGGVVHDVPLGRQRFNPDNEGRFPPQQIFRPFLEGNGSVAAQLGAGLEDAHNPTLAYQPFEGGELFWRGDTNKIYALFSDGSWQVYDNPWRPGKIVSVGYPTPPGRFEPVLGLGEVWRSLGGPSSKLGWATAPQADAQGTAQGFQRGAMLYSPTNNKLYVLYAGASWFSFDNQWQYLAP